MTRSLRILVCSVALSSAALGAQQPSAPAAEPDPANQPRFRAGANLVRVDAYVTAEGTAVTDLTMQEFEVLEDDVPQRIESFRLVAGRDENVATLREPNTVAESRDLARDPDTRVFVLFMDLWHVQIEGSFRAQGPITKVLDRVIGRGDMVGVMHPDMAARNMTFTRRLDSIAGILKDHWYWGERGKVNSSDPREEEIRQCYMDAGDTMGIAEEMIRRRREGKTLSALEGLIDHLEGVREDRKFVFVLTEGWLLRGPDQSLARTLKNPEGGPGIPTPAPIGVDPQGRLRVDSRDQGGTRASCERERSMLAFTDHRSQFDRLVQRANRANVSFYPIDPRGLVVFDEPINSSRALTMYGRQAGPVADGERLGSRRDSVRVLAENTDGLAIVDTNDIERPLQRILQDTSSYYLLGYYSSNTRLDGRYRKLTVRVKRPGAEVRARPGYLAPTEAELASTRVEALMNGAPPGHTTIPPSIARAFAGLGPMRGTMPLRLQTAASASRLWITGELDAALAKAPEWQGGGRIRAQFEHENGATPRAQAEGQLASGERAFQLSAPDGLVFAPGRYVVRIEVLPTGGQIPVQTTTDIIIPERDWLLSPSALSARRGPSTGLQYVATADARYRRTERIRLEIPRSDRDGQVSAQLLGRDGQPLNVAIALSERLDGDQRLVVADVTLAPLAQGEYAVEVVVEDGDRKESATYAFRLIP